MGAEITAWDSGAKRYQQLGAWKKSIELVEMIYLLSEKLPSSQRFSLCDQMQRAAVSVPANIAKGYGRLHRGDYVHHLSIARGSLAELETHLVIAVRLKFLSREETAPAWEQAQETGRLLNGLINSLRSKPTGNGGSRHHGSEDVPEPSDSRDHETE